MSQTCAARVIASVAGLLWLATALLAWRRSVRAWRVAGVVAMVASLLGVIQVSRQGTLEIWAWAGRCLAAIGVGVGLWVVALKGWRRREVLGCCLVAGGLLALSAFVPLPTSGVVYGDRAWLPLATALYCVSAGTLVSATTASWVRRAEGPGVGTRTLVLVGAAMGLQVVAALGFSAGMQSAVGGVLRWGSVSSLAFVPPLITGTVWLEYQHAAPGAVRSALFAGWAAVVVLLAVIGVYLVEGAQMMNGQVLP